MTTSGSYCRLLYVAITVSWWLHEIDGLTLSTSSLARSSSHDLLLFRTSNEFHGQKCWTISCASPTRRTYSGSKSFLDMRKQKASDKRTRRRQQSGEDGISFLSSMTISRTTTITTSPMDTATWVQKKVMNNNRNTFPSLETDVNERNVIGTTSGSGGGRGRSRKRSNLYVSLAYYHQYFLRYLTAEYQTEEDEVLGRIKSSLDDGTPIGLELAGYAFFDMYIERRGNLFQDEVYRVTKATDATTSYPKDSNDKTQFRYLPSNHKFTNNDVILITVQPAGSGDYFFVPPAILSSSSSSLQTSGADPTLPSSFTSGAASVEARVLNVGPTYVDIVMSPGIFERTFGVPASNDRSGTGDKSMRFRIDRFFSEVPYQRMVSALSQLTIISPSPTKPKKVTIEKSTKKGSIFSPNSKVIQETRTSEKPSQNATSSSEINMDKIFRDAILSTFAFSDTNSPLYNDPTICDIDDLSRRIARPPLGPLSQKLANQVMDYMQQNPHGVFQPFNGPQRVAIESALTRRLTMIQGPPGTGKTASAAAIGFGFVHQCRSLSSPSTPGTTNKKVLACAFSNVGADNLAEAFLKLGLKVVRIGKPSAVSQSLWNHTLEAAIDRDSDAQKAIQNAARVTAQLSSLGRQSNNGRSKSSSTVVSASEQKSFRDAATFAVKASIEASNIAATKALREADIVVSTLTGASDPRLLAACGISINADDDDKAKGQSSKRSVLSKTRTVKSDTSGSSHPFTTPDGLPPLSLPFVIIDEACQSVEPATLIPIVSTNTCRSLVMLGDPCQLPPTVRSQEAALFLSLSLMERLAATLNLADSSQPKQQLDTNILSHKMDDSYLNALPVKQAVSLIQARSRYASDDQSTSLDRRSYKKLYNGSYLLSIQYRMHPSIAALPSAIFYNSLLSTPAFMSQLRSFPDVLRSSMECIDPAQCVRIIDVGGRNNERQGMLPKSLSSVSKYYASQEEPSFSASSLGTEKTTYWNEAEAVHVVSLIKQLLRNQKDASDNFHSHIRTIGVISPYNGQVQLIKSMIADDSELRDLIKGQPTVSIEVKSVDGYQGRERDVIIFSCVRSNRQQRIGFLQDWRRMNVALTRAKSALVVVGDLETLSVADKHWDALVKWAIGSGCTVATKEHDR